jgi:LAS superfamily LD-carboxypeptidase LdcB
MTSRMKNDRGQAVIPLVAGCALVLLGVLVLAQFGGVLAARGADQRNADLAATAAAQQMARDYSRVLEPVLLPSGAPNPHHLSLAAYRRRAAAAANRLLRLNGGRRRSLRVRLVSGPAPTAVNVETSSQREVRLPGGEQKSVRVRTRARAQLRFSFPALADPLTGHASGGGYSGPLAYRQGKPMRPDVAAAFDAMAAAARRAGLLLTVNSGFRSDAEQARLFAAHPDPKWVAPPGTSLHRYGTELDLGPPAAYAWLAANCRRFGFIKRYYWEPWHFGFGANPRDQPSHYEAGLREPKSGSSVSGDSMPAWVPARYRPMIIDAAQRHNVQPILLAAQLKAESDFNPNSVSPAGAQGIAQFMPGTARSVGLADPFDPRAAILAQAKLMASLLRQFHSIPKALAAYNAGPGAVIRYGGVPPFAETEAYVARILALMKGAGAQLDDPAFAGIGFEIEVALVR